MSKDLAIIIGKILGFFFGLLLLCFGCWAAALQERGTFSYIFASVITIASIYGFYEIATGYFQFDYKPRAESTMQAMPQDRIIEPPKRLIQSGESKRQSASEQKTLNRSKEQSGNDPLGIR
jgi:hypothetical protein